MFDEFKNAFSKPRNAHVQLIIINVVVFVVFAILMVFSTFLEGDSFFTTIHNQFQIPASFIEFLSRPWTIISYAFMHDLSDIWHIVFNMLVLYWFGRLFVEYLGSDKFIAVYVLGAISGAIAFLLAYNTIPVFVEQVATHGGGMVGASAAVDAVVVAAATLLPNYTFHLLLLGPVRIKYIAMVTVFLSFLGTVGTNAGGNFAHLGGALIGFVYVKQLQAGVNWGAWITATLDWIRSLFENKPKVKVTYRKADEPKSTSTTSGKKVKASQEEIDAILDKISDHGYDSLSKMEKEKLFNASKK